MAAHRGTMGLVGLFPNQTDHDYRLKWTNQADQNAQQSAWFRMVTGGPVTQPPFGYLESMHHQMRRQGATGTELQGLRLREFSSRDVPIMASAYEITVMCFEHK